MKDLNSEEKYSKFLQDIIKTKNNSSLFFFIGAGVSISQGYPTWEDYVDQLIEYWKFNLINIYKENSSENDENDFSFKDLRLLDELKESTMSKKRKIDYVNYLIEKICDNISKNEEYDSDFYYKRESLDFEKFLFMEVTPIDIVNKVLDELMNIKASFITTNYDNQIEKSYNNKFGIRPFVIRDLNYTFNDLADDMVIHLHGTPNSDPNFFINSSTNYSSIYFGKSLDQYRDKINKVFKDKNNVTIVFVGCSMEEDEVLSLFDLENSKYNFYSMMRYNSKQKELSDFSSEYYLQTKNIRYRWYGEQFEELPEFLHKINKDINNIELKESNTPEDIERALLG